MRFRQHLHVIYGELLGSDIIKDSYVDRYI